jgi:pyruvate/2-oxoglutarate dehydrogenase complex dihydrolipoamide dehydrogenase (E3) component
MELRVQRRKSKGAKRPTPSLSASARYRPYRPFPGFGEYSVLAGDVETGKAAAGRDVVIIGAGFTGSECAIPLARAGKNVTIIDMISRETYESFCFGAQTWISVQRILRENSVRFIFGAKLQSVTTDGVTYVRGDGRAETKSRRHGRPTPWAQGRRCQGGGAF